MRIFRVTSALLLIMSYILSGCEPTSSISDVPTQAHLHHIHFVDQNNGWVGGSGGTLFQTTNGGQSWLPLTNNDDSTNLPEKINSFFFTSREHGWLVSLRGEIYYTNNGGRVWRQQAGGLANGLTDIFFNERVLRLGCWWRWIGFAHQEWWFKLGKARHSGYTSSVGNSFCKSAKRMGRW